MKRKTRFDLEVALDRANRLLLRAVQVLSVGGADEEDQLEADIAQFLLDSMPPKRKGTF